MLIAQLKTNDWLGIRFPVDLYDMKLEQNDVHVTEPVHKVNIGYTWKKFDLEEFHVKAIDSRT